MFETIFRLARLVLLRFRCYQVINMELHYYIVVDIETNISKLTGVAEMTKQANNRIQNTARISQFVDYHFKPLVGSLDTQVTSLRKLKQTL